MSPVPPLTSAQAQTFDGIKRNFGRFYFFAVSLTSFFNLLHRGRSGHYDFFSASAVKIWANQNPYGIAYPLGNFNYSPSCALFFYGLFSWMPYSVGLASYMLSSWLVFYVGSRLLLREARLPSNFESLFYFLVSSEIIGSLLNARLEVFITGIVFLALALLMIGRHPRWALFLLAMVSNWKMQSFPTVGLIFIVLLVCRKDFKSVLSFFFSLAFWYLLPFTVKPVAFLRECHLTWWQSLDNLSRAEWIDFQHFFRFLWKVFGIQIPWAFAQIIAVAVGLAFAVFLFLRLWPCRSSPDSLFIRQNLLLAAALGSSFTVVFSPASQSASYILTAPLVLMLVQLLRDQKSPRAFRSLGLLLALGFFCVSLAYSDVVGKSLRVFFFDHALKPFGVVLWTSGLFLFSRNPNCAGKTVVERSLSSDNLLN